MARRNGKEKQDGILAMFKKDAKSNPTSAAIKEGFKAEDRRQAYLNKRRAAGLPVDEDA